MATTPALHLSLIDVHGDPLKVAALVRLRNQSSSALKQVRSSANKALKITGLRGRPEGLYRLEVDAPGYQSSSLFVELKASGVTSTVIVMAVDPGRVRAVRFPAFADLPAEAQLLLENSPQVRGFEGHTGRALYDMFDDVRRAGLLNIIAKTRVTTPTPGVSVMSRLEALLDLRGDRCFCAVPQSLRDDTKNAMVDGFFKQVDGGLHHFEDGFVEAGSFKTLDNYGNLQLTYFASSDTPSRWVADIDIDDCAGITHLFQVVRNELKNQATHPFDIHQILVKHQSLDPLYRLLV
jgi:hypothetical protein